MVGGRLREVRKEGNSQWRREKRESGKDGVEFKQGRKIGSGGGREEWGRWCGRGRAKEVRGFRSHKWSEAGQSGGGTEAGPEAERALTRHRAIRNRNMA
jgi:hypothetical protein